jgi:hypothetical protein
VLGAPSNAEVAVRHKRTPAHATFVVGNTTLPKNGLAFPRALPFDKWVQLGRALAATHSSVAWLLGDWLIYGEQSYTGRYHGIIELVNLDYKTLRNYAWVARRFPLSRRRDSLSFGHHAEVTALPQPEQDFWLRKAEELGWSRNRLRNEVRASQLERAEIGQSNLLAGSSANMKKLLLKLSGEKLDSWKIAAEKARLTIEEWAIIALDHAAQE